MTARRIAMCAGLLVTWLTAAPAQAVLINWDFAGDKPTGAAVIGTAGDYWNQGNNPNDWSWRVANTITGAPSSLNDSTNAATGVGLTLYSKDVRTADGLKTHNTNTPTNFHAAFDAEYGYPGNANPIDYTITGLTAGASYDVYVLYGWGATTAGGYGDIYAYGGTTRGGNGTTKQTVTYAAVSANPVTGRDYVLFSGVVATGGAINICSRNFSNQDNGVSGFQILQVSGSGDITPPAWVSGWPKADTATSTGFTARAKTNEAGNAYYVVVAGGAPAPTAAQVKAGYDSTGASALKSNTLSLTADTENSVAVTGLSPGTSYDVWFVAQDAVPNLQTAPSKVSVTTHTTFAEWIGTFSGVGIHTGLIDDADFDGMKNFVEFALNSSPADGSTQGKAFLKLATVGGTPNVLTLTVAARSGASFSADGNNQKAVVASDALTYLIEASTTLGDWGTPVVTEVTGDDATAIQATLTPSAPGTGWTYHTFRTAGSAATHAGEFIHVKVTSP